MSETQAIPHPNINSTMKLNRYYENKTKSSVEKSSKDWWDRAPKTNSGCLWVVGLEVNYYFSLLFIFYTWTCMSPVMGKIKQTKNTIIETKWHNRWQRTYFEKEVEPQERAAGDDGEAGGVPAGDCLGHVWGVLEERKKVPTEQGCGSGIQGLDTGENLVLE